MSNWPDISTAPRDGTPHFRGLYVRHRPIHDVTGARCYVYWDCFYGFWDEESDEFVSPSRDDFGWTAEDFTHWAPAPKPPEKSDG